MMWWHANLNDQFDDSFLNGNAGDDTVTVDSDTSSATVYGGIGDDAITLAGINTKLRLKVMLVLMTSISLAPSKLVHSSTETLVLMTSTSLAKPKVQPSMVALVMTLSISDLLKDGESMAMKKPH